jgi:Ribonuclease G/E
MQAAFVDIGLEKAAFLYVDDVYLHPKHRPVGSDVDDFEDDVSEGVSAASLAVIFEDEPKEPPEPALRLSDEKEEKRLIAKIKQALKAIGYTFQAWRQAQGVWLIWRDRDESYKSAKIRLYKFGGQREWKLVRLNSENSWVPVSENNQVAKAIAPLLVELRNLAVNC